jgi:hypothetical protein
METGEKKVEIFDPEKYRIYVLTWATGVMKENLKYKTPSEVFLETSRRLAELDDGVCRIIGFEECAPIKKCFCGHDPHTDDCLTWPHLKLLVLDPNDEERWIHDLWMRPVTFKKSGNNDADAIENSGDVVSDSDTVDSQVPAPATITDKLDELTEVLVPVVVTQDVREMLQAAATDYTLVIFKNGKMSVENASLSGDPELTLDDESGEWLYTDKCAKIGDVIFFDNDQFRGFVSVIEAEPEQLRLLISAVQFSINAILRENPPQIKVLDDL